MSIHDGVVRGVPGSSAKDSSSSSFSMCSSYSTEDASSSSSNGAFDDLSDLISQLPIIHVKKGLSKYYKGKSQSFTSLANVTCLKDLVKRGPRMKPVRSLGLMSQSCKRVYRPNATISLKATRTSSSHSNSKLTLEPFHDSPKSVQ
ncbi:unnamed protein product [Microthlaspi erraticum]|uniref:Oxidative stress 3 n=1 Tax=Microthlaspi erraticum TaxID=1685480 RepID=A0A6D2I9P9_9BRAS|nr:unnamed protein product [Microthlaspi erraticum]